jgi:peptide/nickel transport system permease protein
MWIYSLKRLLIGVFVLFAISMLSFGLTNAAMDPALAIAGQGATVADVEAIRSVYGFDKPVVTRYIEWLKDGLSGDLGESFRQKRSVVEVIIERLPVTLTLGAAALSFALLLSLPLGILAALRSNSWIDRLAMGLALIGQAMPTFWFALLGIVIFSVDLGWLPASGANSWRGYVLPAMALGYYATPTLMRLTRSGMLEVLEADYIRTARAKGLSQSAVVFKHALRNAILPVVSVAAVQFGFMLGGSVVIETIFALPGVGYLAWESISLSDLPVVQAIVLMVAVLYVVLTLASDILNAWLDPRISIA